MQISSTPTAYGGGEAHRLLNMLLRPQGPRTGQDLPGAGPTDSAAPAAAPTQPAGGPDAAQFASKTLASLLSAQEAPPSNADIAGKIIGVADGDGDGSLSLTEVEKAIGADTTSGADPLGQAFAALDTNGDGQIGADELTAALDARQAAQGAHHGHHGHHGHHVHGAQASSSDLAAKILGAADTDGDGSLSSDELQTALGASSSDGLASAIGKLDTDGDGKLSAAELSAGIDAFRAAHHRGAASVTVETASTQAASTQAISA